MLWYEVCVFICLEQIGSRLGASRRIVACSAVQESSASAAAASSTTTNATTTSTGSLAGYGNFKLYYDIGPQVEVTVHALSNK